MGWTFTGPVRFGKSMGNCVEKGFAMKRSVFWMVGALMTAMVLLLGPSAQAGMVAYWKFDGDYLDSSGNNYHGTPVNGPGFGTGVSGQALQLSAASSQYVSTVTADLLGLTGNTFTAVAWVRPNATNATRTIFGTDTGGTNLGLHLAIRDGRAYFGFYANDTPGNRTIPTGQWTHMVWQFDNGRQRIIIDGGSDASTGGHANFQNTWDPVLIGRCFSGNYFDGLLDEVVIYNDVLAPNQVKYLASGGDPTNLPAADPNSFYSGIPTGPVLLGPTLPNGKRNAYQLVYHSEGLTWDQARVDASQHTYMGVPGHLATIHSPVENAFGHAFGSGNRWIGFTDSNATSSLDGQTMPGGGSASNNFQWITGEPVTYTAWGGGEPNNAGGEDAACIRWDGLWNDYPAGSTLGQSDYKLNYYVIEYEIQADGGWRLLPKLGPVKPDGTRNAYEMIMNPSTWVAAKVDAQNRQYLGVQGHLVTLSSAEEDTFVRTFGNGWIGLTDDPNHAPGAFEGGNQSSWPSPPQGQTPQPGQKGYGWAWVTGEPLIYHNWNSGEPNNSGNWEHYAEMTPGWNDLPNYAQSWAMRNYVVEYDINWQAQPAFQARMVQIGSGGADTQLNSAGEALSVALGFGVGAAAGNRYQVITDVSHQPLEINYGSGSAGNFPLDIAYPNGQYDPGDDFTVRVTSRVYIPEGEWTIAFAGDDGGYLHLDGIQFINQINTNNDWKTNDGTLIWQDQTSHGVTIGHFVSPPGGITTTLDAMTFERGGGQHFEISIAPGHWPGYNAQAFGLLADGQYGWRATPTPPQNGFNVRMIQLDPSNPPGFDNEINTTLEAITLISNVTGPGDYNIGGSAYRVSKYIETQSPYVDFGGGGGYFNEPTLLYPDGTSDAGEDFLVGVHGFIRMPPGTWTIGFASDDGGVLRLINTHGAPIQFTQEINTNGDGVLDDTILYNGTRGHASTMGIFTLTSEAYLELQSLFFERGGGDSYEIFLAKGAFTEFNTTDFFILRNGVFPGLLVAPELLAVVPEPSGLALAAVGGLALAALAFRRRKTQ